MFYRAEDKFICSDPELELIQRKLSAVLKSDSNENHAAGYCVISLYFDDITDSCLSDTIDGVQIRHKYRVRIYNHDLSNIKLEVKEKYDNRIYKKSKTITAQDLRLLMDGHCISDSSHMQDPATMFNLAIRTRGLRPKIIVAYDRKAFVYEPGNTRITIDRCVRYSCQTDLFGSSDAVYETIPDYNSVLEVKYDEFIPGFILQLLEIGNLQQSAFSKYQLCRSAAAKYIKKINWL